MIQEAGKYFKQQLLSCHIDVNVSQIITSELQYCSEN